MKILLSLLGNTIGTTGGVEKVLCNMANAMVERGHDVTILTFEDKCGYPFFYLDKKVDFINLGIGHKLSHFFFNVTSFYLDKDEKELKRLMCDCKQIADIIREKTISLGVDIIITFEKRSEVVFKEFIELDVPIITMFHFNYNNILQNHKLHYIYEKSNCIQVLTNNDLIKTKELIKNPRIICIPNAVPQYEELALLANQRIITVGRIDPRQKRQHLLIEAFALIHNKYSKWIVDIYGDKNFDRKYYKHCCRLIEKYGLQDKIKFCGTTNNVREELLKSSIFAFPSAYEGFPLALTEALSVGLPAVGYKSCAGTNEVIIDGENGFLCDDCVDSLAFSLDKLMGDRELRVKMGKVAKTDMKQFSPEKIWNKWESLIEEVLRN